MVRAWAALTPIVLSASLAACSGLPAPVAPTQGVYGYVRQDEQFHANPLVGEIVVALSLADLGPKIILEGAPTATTDVHGNFSISLPTGIFEVCFVDGNVTAKCDCTFTVREGSQIERDYLREATSGSKIAGWAGGWTPANPESSCIPPPA